MTAAPPLIALDDLDREELLQLVTDRLPYAVSQHDLWSARWKALARRAEAAGERKREADAAYYSLLLRPADPSTMSRRAWSALQSDREAKRLLSERAARAARRAHAAEDRAWDAYMASDQRRPLKAPMTGT